MKLILSLVSTLAGVVMRRHFRCVEHKPIPGHRPLTCGDCWTVLEDFG